MSINSNSAISYKDLNKMTVLAAEGKPDQAIAVLKTCPLNTQQTATITGILTNAPSTHSEAEKQKLITLMKHEIVMVQSGNVQEIGDEQDADGNGMILPDEIDAENGMVLPDDTLIKIFGPFDAEKEIPAIACTCKYWNTVVNSETFCIQQLNKKESLWWGELVTLQEKLGGEAADFDCVFRYCKNLKKLDLACAFRRGDAQCQENEFIVMIESAGKYCPNLKIMDFTFCDTVVDRTMDCLAANLPHLTHLGLQGCKFMPPGFQSLILGCNNLISLNLSYTAIGDEQILLIANHCPNLCELDLTSSCNVVYTGDVTDRSITVLAQKCPSLTHLSIPFSRITALSLQALGEHCKGLVYLYHNGCFSFNNEDLNVLKEQLPNLVTSDDVREYVLPKLPKK